MFTVVLVVSQITRFERISCQTAVSRERRRLRRERLELSRGIHDASAQTAYMIDLGATRDFNLHSTLVCPDNAHAP